MSWKLICNHPIWGHLNDVLHIWNPSVIPTLQPLKLCCFIDFITHSCWTSLSICIKNKQTQWPYSASELYQPSDHRLSAKLVPNFADKRCCMVSATDPHGRILSFLDRSRYYFFQVAPQLYSRGWVHPVPDPLHLRKSGIRNSNYCLRKVIDYLFS
jgi:hypothetical protein